MVGRHYEKYASWPGRMVIVGFGSIGQGVLPLILRHLDLEPGRLTIVTAEERGREEAERFGVRFVRRRLTEANLRQVLGPKLHRGDLIINLSVDVSSVALVELAQQLGCLYIDTCIEPWPGGYTDTSLPASQRSNYGLRHRALALRDRYPTGPTAVFAHGANPGLVSHLLKQSLLNIAGRSDVKTTAPTDRQGWAKLSQRLSIKVIHIAERDTQIPKLGKRAGEFVNTWSVDGFISEGSQPAELGWGTHERRLPPDGRRHGYGSECAIYMERPGLTTRVRTWTPLEGPFHGFLITHNEAISIADHLTVKRADRVVYRPTVHYAYHPCDAAVSSMHELAGKNFVTQRRKRLIVDEVVSGIDELGVLVMGHAQGAYWYGSQLSIDEARRLAPYNNATSLQVVAAVLSGIVWAIENPEAGIVEADDMDFRRNLEICMPYLGPVVGKYTDWTPLTGRETLFPEDLDRSDPWQFQNFRVA